MSDLSNVNFSFNDSGTLQFSGLSSGIDIQGAVDAIMQAKRQPVVRLENKIVENNQKISAFAEMKDLSAQLRDSLQGLRGQVGFFAESTFDQKAGFTTSREAAVTPAGYTGPSSAEQIMGVSVESNAQASQHTIEVVQLAKANQIRSDAIGDKFTPLSGQGVTTGTFTLNGQNIIVDADDTLLDLRDKINNANTGATPTGATASIVSAGTGENFLVLSSSDTGTSNNIDLAGGNAVTDSLGLTDAGAVKNEIQASQDAIIRVDNLGVDITRESNTIDDVLEGVTFDLFKAEEGTEIVLDVENDLAAVKENFISFVETFNAVKDFIDDQRAEKVRTEGGEKEFGAIAFDSTLRNLSQQLNSIMASEVPGQPSGFRSLAQVGVEFNENFRLEINDEKLDNNLLQNLDEVKGLFEFQMSTSDSRVTLTGFDQNTQPNLDGSGEPIPYYLNIDGTDANGDVTGANLQETAGSSASDGSVGANGKNLAVTDQSDAEGLRLRFNGGPNLGPVNDVEITFTRGIADQLFFAVDEFAKNNAGTIDQNISDLTQQSTDFEDRILRIEDRLAIQRKNLMQRFIAMEQAVAQANSLRDSLEQQTQALNGGS